MVPLPSSWAAGRQLVHQTSDLGKRPSSLNVDLELGLLTLTQKSIRPGCPFRPESDPKLFYHGLENGCDRGKLNNKQHYLPTRPGAVARPVHCFIGSSRDPALTERSVSLTC